MGTAPMIISDHLSSGFKFEEPSLGQIFPVLMLLDESATFNVTSRPSPPAAAPSLPKCWHHLELRSLFCFSSSFFAFSYLFPLLLSFHINLLIFFSRICNYSCFLSSPYIITEEKCGLCTPRPGRELWPGPSIAIWFSEPL